MIDTQALSKHNYDLSKLEWLLYQRPVIKHYSISRYIVKIMVLEIQSSKHVKLFSTSTR